MIFAVQQDPFAQYPGMATSNGKGGGHGQPVVPEAKDYGLLMALGCLILWMYIYGRKVKT